MLQDATFWVAISFFAFIVLSYKKIGQALTAFLDKRTAQIQNELENARRLREDAEKFLADCQRRHADASNEAERIVTHAKAFAQQLRDKSEGDLKQAIARREAQALERIAQIEAAAVSAVRNSTVDLAIDASRQVLAERAASGSHDAAVDKAIADLPRHFH